MYRAGAHRAKRARQRDQDPYLPPLQRSFRLMVRMARLKTKYLNDVVPAMMQEFNYKNSMQVPRLTKITLNVGLGEATQNVKVVDTAVAEITLITGQRPVVTRAKKAIANFKLREGVPI